MKRAGIYFFFDSDGIVDRYVPYYIQELHKVVDYIVVVANGKLTVEGRKILTQAADDLFVRQNKGYDVWAYKDALEYIGWDQLYTYDELVLTNSTVYGPIFPFQETFDRMDKKPCDFWGMYQTYARKEIKSWFGISLPDGIPNHITSNFHVFRKRVLHCHEFKQFWNEMPMINSYFESNVYYEMEIAKRLREIGFTVACADENNFEHFCPSPTVYAAFDAIKQCRIPIVRKKAFFDPNGSLDYCSDYPRMIMEYINEHTSYNCGLIWENLLRTVNLYDLKSWFNWNNILPVNYATKHTSKCKIGVIFHMYYADIISQYMRNIEAFPAGADFYITTNTAEKEAYIKQLLSPLSARYSIEYRRVENRGRDVSALLVACRDVVMEGKYDLVCFMHDKKGIGNDSEYVCIGKSFSECCFENVAANENYIKNVVDLFENQSELGVAVPPCPKNGNYYSSIGGFWAENYEGTVKLLESLNIDVPIDEEKPPVSAYGSVFWFRPKALLPIFKRKWSYEDFEAEPMRNDGTISNCIERAYGFVAQSQGYYTAVIINSKYAEQEVTRMTEIAHTYVNLARHYIGGKQQLSQVTQQFEYMLQQQTTPYIQGKLRKSSPKVFIRGICPIGLWNLIRRVKCAASGAQYVEPDIKRGAFKTVIRACMPRYLWDALRKAKCRENGWTFVED